MQASLQKYLRQELLQLATKMLRQVQTRTKLLKHLSAGQLLSAANLLHYLTLRSEDMRKLQEELHHAGLSSLASSESHILYQLQSVLENIGEKIKSAHRSECDPQTGRGLLQQRTETLFGPGTATGIPYIMVTFDTGLATDQDNVHHLLAAGMNVARINCAHDDPDTWLQMIRNVRRASSINCGRANGCCSTTAYLRPG